MKLASIIVLGTLMVILGGCEPEAEPGDTHWGPKIDYTKQFFEPGGELRLSRSEVLYVPVYSGILMGQGARPTEMAATLAIRNTDADTPIFVTLVEYYNAAGQLIETFLDGTYGLGPMASASIVIDVADKRGGFGANFVVKWGAEGPVSDPVVETVMVGGSGTKGFSFTSPARVIKAER